jgi:hypothetical protein
VLPAGDFLVRNIARFEEIIKELDALPQPGNPPRPQPVLAH